MSVTDFPRTFTPHVVETPEPAPSLGTVAEIYGSLESAVLRLAWPLAAFSEGSELGGGHALTILDDVSEYMAALRVKLASPPKGAA